MLCPCSGHRERHSLQHPGQVRGLLCISSALAPSVLLSPGTALVGPVTPPGLVHATLFTLLFPPENFYLSFKAQLKDLP